MPTANDTNFKWHTLSALIVSAMALSMLVSAGCRSTRDNQMDLLERELRAQEDYIYELEDYVVEYSDKLRQCRCSQAHVASTTKPTPAPKPSSRTTPSRSTVEKASPRKSLQEPQEDSILESEEPESEPVTPIEELEVPVLELEIGEPIGSDETGDTKKIADLIDEEALPPTQNVEIPDPITYQAVAYNESDALQDESLDELTATDDLPFEDSASGESLEGPGISDARQTVHPSGRKAERLVITHVLRDSTESPEPSSLLTVIEARDSRNEPADFDGRVSLMVMQGKPEAPNRIKRWDFTEEETSAAWQTSHLGDGLHLELPLEVTRLPSEACELWVRLEAADGRKLLAQVALEVSSLAKVEDIGLPQQQLATDALPLKEETEVQVASLNPLRAGSEAKLRSTPRSSSKSASTPEPQWRAATHFSTGANSGFATTATDQKWTSGPSLLRSSKKNSGKQRWTSRK